VDFAFIAAALARDNDLVLRVKSDKPATRVRATLPLTAQDAEAGVVSDQLVELTGRDAPRGIFRLVTIVTTDRRGEPETIRLLTNLIDASVVAAHVIGAVYRLRWRSSCSSSGSSASRGWTTC
jgi:hypothetical protein